MKDQMSRVIIGLFFGLSLNLSPLANAAMLNVSNNSFELPAIAPDSAPTPPAGWGLLGTGHGAAHPGPSFLTSVPDGEQVGAIFGGSFEGYSQYASSAVTFTSVQVQADYIYTLTFYQITPADQPDGSNSGLFVTLGSTASSPVDYASAVPSDFFDLKDEIDAGGDGGSALVIANTFPGPAPDTAVMRTVQFTTPSSAGYLGEYLYFTLGEDTIPGVVYYDLVTLDASPIPEPASLALLGLGSLLVAGRRRAH